ncbi:unnamed protein product, partial [Amoebophrya sp. A120]
VHDRARKLEEQLDQMGLPSTLERNRRKQWNDGRLSVDFAVLGSVKDSKREFEELRVFFGRWFNTREHTYVHVKHVTWKGEVGEPGASEQRAGRQVGNSPNFIAGVLSVGTLAALQQTSLWKENETKYDALHYLYLSNSVAASKPSAATGSATQVAAPELPRAGSGVDMVPG